MATVKNRAYYGRTGSVLLDGDTHAGVTSFQLVPTTPTESVADIGGDVQVFTGVPTWLANIEFHQDHKTVDSISKQSPAWAAGEPIPFIYTPDDGGEGRSGLLRWIDVPFGGGTTRHSVSTGIPVVGQPTIVAAE